MKKPTIEKLFELADQHAVDSGEPDHAVGDLQGLLREAVKLMTKEQKKKFYNSEPVTSLVDGGEHGA